MKYSLPSKKTGYKPELYSFLCGLDDEKLFYDDHSLMHPADIFTTVFDEVIESGVRLIDDLNNLQKSKANDNNEEGQAIKSSILNFIFSLSNFIDASKSIIKCLFKSGDKELAKASRKFVSNCKDYINHVSKMINYVKHRHRNIGLIKCSWDDQVLIGYYINGIVEKGMTGPEPDIHGSPNVAISINRDISYHIINVYFLSASLSSTLSKYVKSTENEQKTDNQDKLLGLLTKIAKLPKNLLPDEFSKPAPEIKMKANKPEVLELEYPSKKFKALNNHSHNMDITMMVKVGYKNRGFATPYSVPNL